MKRSKKIRKESEPTSADHPEIPTCNVNVVIQHFPGKGLGVVTEEPIQKYKYVCEYCGSLLLEEEAVQKQEEYEKNTPPDKPLPFYMFQFEHGGQFWSIDATYSPYLDKDLIGKRCPGEMDGRYIGRLLNHSRKGNIYPRKIVDHNSVPRIRFFAKKKIKAGEELTFDYGQRDRQTLKEFPWLRD